MTDIEKKALELVNQVRAIEKKALELVNQERAAEGLGPVRYVEGAAPCSIRDALHRAIEAHEADKARHAAEMEAFKREVSEAVEEWIAKWQKCTPSRDEVRAHFARFITPQPDPLDGVIYGAGFGRGNAELLREAADRQGYRLELVKKEPSQ